MLVIDGYECRNELDLPEFADLYATGGKSDEQVAEMRAEYEERVAGWRRELQAQRRRFRVDGRVIENECGDVICTFARDYAGGALQTTVCRLLNEFYSQSAGRAGADTAQDRGAELIARAVR